jgi:hypothetical protein
MSAAVFQHSWDASRVAQISTALRGATLCVKTGTTGEAARRRKQAIERTIATHGGTFRCVCSSLLLFAPILLFPHSSFLVSRYS